MTRRNALQIAAYLQHHYGESDIQMEAVAMLRAQHAEIEQLKAQFDPSKFAHHPDCARFGATIDAQCLGCTMAERESYEAKIARLDGENAVLRDLLRSSRGVIETIEGENTDECEDLSFLLSRIDAAIDGKAGGLFGEINE